MLIRIDPLKRPARPKTIATTAEGLRGKLGNLLRYKKEDLDALMTQAVDVERGSQDIDIVDIYLEISQTETVIGMLEKRYKELELQLSQGKEIS